MMDDTRNKIFIAVNEGKLEELRNLVNHSRLPNKESWVNDLLCAAIEKGYEDITNFLLCSEVDCNPKNTNGKEEEDKEEKEEKEDEGEEKEAEKEEEEQVEEKEAKEEEEEIVKIPLYVAAAKGYVNIVKLLLQHGADPNVKLEEYGTPLYAASKYNFYKTAEILLQNHADPDLRGENDYAPLHIATQNDCRKMANLFLDHGAMVDAKIKYNDCTPLHIAAAMCHLRIAKLLLKCKASVHSLYTSEYRSFYTPLHSAVYFNCSGSEEMIKLLLENWADINAYAGVFYTPLHMAIEEESLESLMALLSAKQSATVYEEGPSALHIAAASGETAVIDILLEAGSTDLNEIDYATEESGLTPLHVAVRKSKIEAVDALLRYGADLNVKSTSGYTALQDIEEWDHDIATRLVSHIMMLKSQNIFISEKNLDILAENEPHDFLSIVEGCEQEINFLKETAIGKGNLSFYDILVKHGDHLHNYARNEKVVQVIEYSNCDEKFPFYGHQIKYKFSIAKIRLSLIQQSTEILHAALNDILRFPHVCAEKITSFLSDKDLFHILRAKQTKLARLNEYVNNVKTLDSKRLSEVCEPPPLKKRKIIHELHMLSTEKSNFYFIVNHKSMSKYFDRKDLRIVASG